MKQAFRVEDGTYGSRVVVTSSWGREVANYILDNDVKELYLNYAWGWKGDDISFLSELTNLEAFFILDWAIKDISPIHFLTSLKFLHVSTYCDSKIDFACFPNLEECHLEWRRGAESLLQCRTLKNLWLNRYGGASSAAFQELQELRSLSLASAALKEIHGLSSLWKLEVLGLFQLRKLRSLEGVEKLRCLQSLDIEKCRVGSISEIQGLVNLKRLRIADCGKIDSLKPIRGLKQLESLVFYGSTNVIDGDLSPLLTLEHLSHVAFRDRSHYSNALVEFPSKALPGKQGLRA